jgi:His-Xaa-Ser system radical SAM maturase HxsB
LTNDIGDHGFLTHGEFDALLTGRLDRCAPEKYTEFCGKGFIRNAVDLESFRNRFFKKNYAWTRGTNLHIIVVTLRCEHKCIYCQAGSSTMSDKNADMDKPTARKIVERIFESPNENITIEFQGGEPLANWAIVKYIVVYAKEVNKKARKDIFFSLVSNFSLLTDEKLRFLIKNNVSLCTSLDGPRFIHRKNRPALNDHDRYGRLSSLLKKIHKEIKNHKTYEFHLNALTTVSSHSLPFPREIIDEFRKLGFNKIHLRPVNPFGMGLRRWKKIGYSAEKFLSFYKRALDYIIELNLKGVDFYERKAKIFLQKIFTETDPNYMDLRSPCGASIGQLAYHYNGNVYTCDEARMLATQGDETFCLGNVFKDSYADLINHPTAKTVCMASCLDNLPGCTDCVYKPYCGTCPIYNYVTSKDIFCATMNNDVCKINKGILDLLFKKMHNKRIRQVLFEWTQKT